MPMGPIELCDQIGLDVCFDVGQVLGMSDIASQALKIKWMQGNWAGNQGLAFISGMIKRLCGRGLIIRQLS